MRWLIAFGLAVLLAGCGSVTTKYPIGTTTGLPRDDALSGTWKGPLDSEDGKSPALYMHFLKVKNGPMLGIWVATRFGDEGYGGAILFDVSTAKLGDNRYISAREYKAGSGKPEGNYRAVLYRYDGAGTLTLFALDQEKALAAIREGKIAGTVDNDKNAVITAEPSALDAFFAKLESADLFSKQMVLTKQD